MLIRYLLCALCLSLTPLSSFADSVESQRELFQQAYQAIQNKDYESAHALTESLREYPLYYFLRYHLLRARGNNLTHPEVYEFLSQYGESVVGESLRQDWLSKLAMRRAWSEFLSIYTPQKNTDLQCFYVQARLNDPAQAEAALQDMKIIWLTGKNLPEACSMATAALYNSPIMDSHLIWQRIRLAMQKNNAELAAVLAKRLNPTAQSWAARWQAVHKNPAANLDTSAYPNIEYARDILLHGIRRIASKDAGSARAFWDKIQSSYSFTEEQQGNLLRDIALQAAKQYHPQAIRWLATIPANSVTEEVNSKRLLFALETQNWQAVANFIQNTPEDQRNTYQSQYWLARALEQLGKKEAAQGMYQNLAKVRDYYGFMAANRINAPYQMQDYPTVYSEGEANEVLHVGGIIRAFELFRVGLRIEARKEWSSTVKNLSPRNMEIAATLASRAGWHDRAVMTAVKAGNFDDLSVRFPLAFQQQLSAAANNQGIDLSWVYGIVRQESAFMWDARSHVGALGLMQLMPATGRMMARKVGLSVDNGERDMLQIDNNIAMGTAYLRMLSSQFDGNFMLATAGYNAGPGRSKAWVAKYGCLPADAWVEMIPFSETKNYVKRVLFFTSVFEARLGLPSQPMRVTLPSGSCSNANEAVPLETTAPVEAENTSESNS